MPAPAEAHYNQEQRAADDRCIGEVECGPVIARDMEIQVVDNRANSQAIDDVAQRAAKYSSKRRRL